MPRGHSKYLDDAYGAFVEDVRLAYERARQYRGGMSDHEWNIVHATHDTLLKFDPDAADVFPIRTARGTNLKV